jgi:hypothetical protein
VFFKPNKQMLFVYASNFVEQKIETFNPNPKDVFYYRVEGKQLNGLSDEPGSLRITTEPNRAVITINGVRSVNETPFSGELPPQLYSLNISKLNFIAVDTVVSVTSGQTTFLNIKLRKVQGRFNISSTPEAAEVFIGGQYKGKTPLQGSIEVGHYEVEVKLEGYTAAIETMQVATGHLEQLDFTMRNPTSMPTVIGQEYSGGVVFELRKGGHGLIVALEDQSRRDTNWNRAKRLCDEYTGGGFTDWHLPSRDELNKLYNNRHKVNDVLVRLGGRKLAKSYSYWSSTEASKSSAWKQYFTNGFQSSNDKYLTNFVRAVRAF